MVLGTYNLWARVSIHFQMWSISSFLRVNVYLHGTSSPLPDLLCPSYYTCRVCLRTAGCCNAIILELQYGHLKINYANKKSEKCLFNITTRICWCALFSNHA